ncbi:TIGR01777 family protein [Herbidospora galbida]|uniref:TIGR01777 family protein n=1 Tax=Herbidospora galbida TaxID=2575442 RepID=A0A4U3LWR5_9ACTN|nr:TIGR01777 family oxidoreductase [Herbidospora galbida]TKK80655.1 TIGR01777 family protein [Herbidospora galbida]
MKIAVTGASGLIGTALTASLRQSGHEVLSLVRRPPTSPGQVQWDPAGGVLDPADLAGVEAIVHLAGAGIGDHRWTDSYKRTVIESRRMGTSTLVRALNAMDKPPSVLLSGSAVGYYGDTRDRIVDETAPRGAGFLADVCGAWEEAAQPARQSGMRVVTMRTGVVLSKRGGMLGQILPIFRIGMGAPLGSGEQYLSWISVPDWVSAARFLLGADIDGAVNLTAPEPVTNKTFTKEVAAALKRPSMPLAVPGFVLKTAVGGFAEEGILMGQRAVPARLTAAGHHFSHPTIKEALADALR